MKKKITISIISLMAVLVLAFSMAACSTSFVGTYKIESMTYESAGMQMTIKVGQDMGGGVALTEDYMVIEVRDDNTFTLTAAGESMEGTWTSEGKTLKLDLEGEVQDATLSGKTLTLSGDMFGASATITFKKQ